MKNQEAYQRAEKRVEAKMGFYRHLLVYIAVSILLITINLSRSPESYWFQWPLMIWAGALALHAFGVFIPFEGSAIKKKMIEEEMKKEALKD